MIPKTLSTSGIREESRTPDFTHFCDVCVDDDDPRDRLVRRILFNEITSGAAEVRAEKYNEK